MSGGLSAANRVSRSSCMFVQVGQFMVTVTLGFCFCQVGSTWVSYAVWVAGCQSTTHTSNAAGFAVPCGASPPVPGITPHAPAGTPPTAAAAPPSTRRRLTTPVGAEDQEPALAITIAILLR